MAAVDWAERGFLPDALIRAGIRRLIGRRLREEGDGGPTRVAKRRAEWIETLRASPIAIATGDANSQHYEVPPAFFRYVLGPHLKYSCALFGEGVDDLAAAEAAMLALSAERAEIVDGMRILDLGCGWGSLSMWMAEAFPSATIVAVSNSRSQGEAIRERVRLRGLDNLEVCTADVNAFEPDGMFDRVVSIEMFEHLRNWPAMLDRIAGWLTPEGALFLHVFCHRRYAYPYEDRGPGDWMARHFFSGGMMPSFDLLFEFEGRLAIEGHWLVGGQHYQKTADAWLQNIDLERDAVRAVLAAGPGGADRERLVHRWRLFFLGCSELFGYRGGEEWQVAHYRMRKQGS